jgi:hypothetical protein
MRSGDVMRFVMVGAILAAACLAAGTAAAAPKTGAPAPAGSIVRIDPDECSFFEVRTVVMEANREKGTLVVAEREIRKLDTVIDGRPLKTEFLGQDGKPEAPESFRVGQYVKVEGFLHPEGFVAALVIQKIAKPKEPDLVYRPVADNAKKAKEKNLRRPSAVPAAR